MRMRITGGRHLEGHVDIMGAKNAIAPLVAATLLMKGEARFKRVPRLSDLDKLLDIMQGMGVQVSWLGEHELSINAKDVDPTKIDRKKVRQMRFSVLLLGPMLARFKKMMIPEPGGCSIGNRPIDTHLFALTQLGASIETDDHGSLYMEAKELIGTYVILPEFSVTATENLIMAAVLAKGKTSIRMAAAEYHVQDLCRFLNRAGAKIKGIGSHDLEITGVKNLQAPAVWTVSPDANEIGTFAVAAAATRGDIRMSPVEPAQLDALRSIFSRIGVRHDMVGHEWRVKGVAKMEAFRLQTMIFPGFPTDMQAPFGLLATQCQGTSLIHDPLFESRLGYIQELIKMGANAVVADPHRVIITGPTVLHGNEIRSLDLRAGVTMVLAGMIAEGETLIHDAEMVYRGYERLDERLRALGADIECLSD